MTRHSFFLIISSTIFILERIFGVTTFWPIFIFPVFAVWFMLASQDEPADLNYIAGMSVFFDFFSGFHFGALTLSVLVTCFCIYLAKKHFRISLRSILPLILFLVIFVFEFTVLLPAISFLI